MTNPTKLSKNYERAEDIADRNNARLVSPEIRDTRQKVEFICEHGHVVTKSLDKLRDPPFCGVCSKAQMAKDRQSEIHQTIVEHCRDRGFRLLSTEYVNNRTPLLFECPQNHQFESRWDNFRASSGETCPYCSGSKVFGGLLERAKTLAKDNRGTLLSSEVERAHSVLKWQCAEGHIFQSRLDHVKNGSWCFECALGPRRTTETLNEIANSRGGSCLREVDRKNGQRRFEWCCGEGHQWEASANNIQKGTWCPKCSQGLGERLVRIAFEAIFEKPFPSGFYDWMKSPDSGRPMELDGYNAELKIAFEHQGYLHHSTPEFIKSTSAEFQSRRDQVKRKICESKGITLIEVPEVPRLLSLDDLVPYVEAKLSERGKVVPSHETPDFDRAYLFKPLENLSLMVHSKGGKLLSTKYHGAGEKYSVECGNGHIWQSTIANIKRGSWCPICSGSKREIPVAEEVHRLVESKGGTVLTPEIQRVKQKIEVECAKGHRRSIRVQNLLKNKVVCRLCESSHKPVTLERAERAALAKRGTCLGFDEVRSEQSKGWHKYFIWQCESGHKWSASFNAVNDAGRWCKECLKIREMQNK